MFTKYECTEDKKNNLMKNRSVTKCEILEFFEISLENYTPASQSPRGLIPWGVSFFEPKIPITQRNLNQN